MERPLLMCVSRSDFDFLSAIAVRTGQPISAVLHTLIEQSKRDREANGRLALQVSALVDLHALGADTVVSKAIVDAGQVPHS